LGYKWINALNSEDCADQAPKMIPIIVSGHKSESGRARMDGRVDDPNTGWKGKGLWSTYATYAPTHIEGGKGETSKVVHFQLRPDPLAK
jgi:hypothetical protein